MRLVIRGVRSLPICVCLAIPFPGWAGPAEDCAAAMAGRLGVSAAIAFDGARVGQPVRIDGIAPAAEPGLRLGCVLRAGEVQAVHLYRGRAAPDAPIPSWALSTAVSPPPNPPLPPRAAAPGTAAARDVADVAGQARGAVAVLPAIAGAEGVGEGDETAAASASGQPPGVAAESAQGEWRGATPAPDRIEPEAAPSAARQAVPRPAAGGRTARPAPDAAPRPLVSPGVATASPGEGGVETGAAEAPSASSPSESGTPAGDRAAGMTTAGGAATYRVGWGEGYAPEGEEGITCYTRRGACYGPGGGLDLSWTAREFPSE